MKSKYPKEYSNLKKKMDINVLKRHNELSSSRSFDSQERCELRRANENPGGGVLDQWLGIGVPLRVSNPDPV